MTNYRVSDESLQKVENFFVKKVKELGSKRFEATVSDIAEGSGVAIATAHKAIRQLTANRTIDVIKYTESRRFPITYIYNGDIEGIEEEQSQQEQIEYLQELVLKLKGEVLELQRENVKLIGERNVLRNKIRQSTGG